MMTMVSLDTHIHSTTPFCPPPVTTSTIARKPTFAILPEEIIVNILEWCDFKGVLACQRTCRALRGVVVRSTSLRYKLALSEHGMCDGTSSDLSTADKLELLTAHADAWQNLDKASPEKADMLVGWGPPIAVSCNIMVFSRLSRLPENHRGKWNNEEAERIALLGPRLNLLVVRVPSVLRRVEAAHWLLDLPGNVADLCIDASQNLLIYRSSDGLFYPCMLSAQASHPLVKHGGNFGIEGGGSWGSNVFNLCVCGDFVAGVARFFFISVWNWKTGQLVSNQYISQVNFSSFEFLDEHHILYSASEEDSIYVYDLRRGQKEEEKTRFLRFHLVLPPIDRATTSRYIQLRRNALPTETGPLPDWRDLLEDASIAPGPEPAAPPFYADPHERLIVTRIATSPVEWGEEQFELHLPARAFLEHFPSATTADIGGSRQRDDDGECECECGDEDKYELAFVPWTVWRDAAHATAPRKLPYVIHPSMIVYGMRAVSYPPDWDEGMLHVDSYLPRAKRREGSGEAGADTREEAASAEPAAGVAGTGWRGMRQAIRLPVENKSDFLTALCEDALLCYKVDPRLNKISHAYWYTF